MSDTVCKECNTIPTDSKVMPGSPNGIVHSGTDGFVFGLKAGQLHNICYDCANVQAGFIK